MTDPKETALECGFRPLTAPWPTYSDDRAFAEELVAQMTLDEKAAMVVAPMGYGIDPPEDAIGSAAYCEGVPRLNIPAWDESDASLGVTNPASVRGEEPATAFPAGLALGATFDRELAAEQGRALGIESRATGMSVQLAGGMNLVREPRGGRNFEYLAEDPLLTGVLAGANVKGIQEQGVVSTLKHFALNAQETGRVMVSSDISEPALRESDLLAFQIAIEHGSPRSIMTGYNMLNRVYASESPWLLETVLKGNWNFNGFVMSDWGGTHSSIHAACAGLDRQSGYQLDTSEFFLELVAAVRDGHVAESRLDDMVARIVASLRSVGALEARRTPVALDEELRAEHAAVAEHVARRSILLLRNQDGVLPLRSDLGRLVVVGAGASKGILAGGGSSAVTPPDAVIEEGFSIAQMSMPKVWHRPAPLDALRAAMPDTEVIHLDHDAEHVRATLSPDDTVIVFGDKWATEGRDCSDLSLDGEQDALIEAVASVARRTVVVLETPGAVTMPWLERVDAVLAAWYGGAGGAAAIAAVLTGAENPSGRLPVTFPRDVSQLPRGEMTDPEATTSNPGQPREGEFPCVDYDVEGADVGYRWYQREGLDPLFWFGFGLTYTEYSYEDPSVETGSDGTPHVSFRVKNSGPCSGIDVPQLYIAPPGGAFRLVGWANVQLEAGESRNVRIAADELRSYAHYVVDKPGWRIDEGTYRIRLARSANPQDSIFESSVQLGSKILRP